MKEFEQQQDQQPFHPDYQANQKEEAGQQFSRNQDPNFEQLEDHSYRQKLDEIEKFQQDATQGLRNLVDKGVWHSTEGQKAESDQAQAADEQGPKKEQQMQMASKESIPSSLDAILERLEVDIGYKTSFDVAVREMTIGHTRIAMLSMSGLVNAEIILEVLKRLSFLQADELGPEALESFFTHYIPSAEARKEDDWNLLLASVLSGECALFVDGESTAIVIEVKKFPARGLEEPSLEKVVRGSRDGFIETLMVNVSLVRRRLKDPKLRYEKMSVGARTKTDVCIAYIDDIVDKQLLQEVKRKIEMIKIDGLPLADKQLEEATIKRGWNPFPLVRYSERPDTVASHLLEGAIAIFVDTSPSIMTLPATYTDLMQHAEENRQTPLVGTYLRWVRFIGIIASLLLLPLWILFVHFPEYRPEMLNFLGPKEVGPIPLVLQFMIAEIGIDLMRMASVHTPTSLATAMSLVAAILIGDIAVKTGVFVTEVILYTAVAAVGMFATPSYDHSDLDLLSPPIRRFDL